MSIQKYIATILHFLLNVVQIILDKVRSILNLAAIDLNYNRSDRRDMNDLGFSVKYSNIPSIFQSQKAALVRELSTYR